MCRARGVCWRRRQSDGDGSPAVVATGSVNSDALDAGALGVDLVSETGTAEVARLAVEEGLCEVVVLEGLEGPGGSGMHVLVNDQDAGSGKERTYRRMISPATVLVQVMRSENFPLVP